MSAGPRPLAPTAEEIERRFTSPTVVAARPVILAALESLRLVCRFRWETVDGRALLEHEPPLILAANHTSHADTAAILSTLPGPLRRRTCVAAALDVFGPSAERRGTPKAIRRECLQTVVAAGFHAFAFDRHGPPLRSVRTAVDLVRRGWSLLLYPEGTRSRTGELGPFKAGVGVVAKMSGRPVVPVRVDGGTSILPCGALVPRAGRARVRYGRPLHCLRGESPGVFVDRLRQRIEELGRVPAGAPAVQSAASVPPARLAASAAGKGDRGP